MPTLIHERVELARRGDNPTVICRMDSGWVVLGDRQILEGYCLLLPDPVVPDLNALGLEARARFLTDMSILGDALLEVTGAARINYEILGNSDHALHAHVIPRFDSEPAGLRAGPVWFYDLSAAPGFDAETHRPLMEKIRSAIQKRITV